MLANNLKMLKLLLLAGACAAIRIQTSIQTRQLEFILADARQNAELLGAKWYHGTSAEAVRLICQSKMMKPGRDGKFGEGIYLTREVDYASKFGPWVLEFSFAPQVLQGEVQIALLSSQYPYGWSTIPKPTRQSWCVPGVEAVYGPSHLVSGGKGDEFILLAGGGLHSGLTLTGQVKNMQSGEVVLCDQIETGEAAASTDPHNGMFGQLFAGPTFAPAHVGANPANAGSLFGNLLAPLAAAGPSHHALFFRTGQNSVQHHIGPQFPQNPQLLPGGVATLMPTTPEEIADHAYIEVCKSDPRCATIFYQTGSAALARQHMNAVAQQYFFAQLGLRRQQIFMEPGASEARALLSFAMLDLLPLLGITTSVALECLQRVLIMQARGEGLEKFVEFGRSLIEEGKTLVSARLQTYRANLGAVSPSQVAEAYYACESLPGILEQIAR